MNDPKSVRVLYDAEVNTASELLAFIGNGGLGAMEYVGTEPWRNNPHKEVEILIDAYKFWTNRMVGYIAFMKGFNIRFIIKSFHLNNDKITLSQIGNNSIKPLR
jgi:hypothetical protein